MREVLQARSFASSFPSLPLHRNASAAGRFSVGASELGAPIARTIDATKVSSQAKKMLRCNSASGFASRRMNGLVNMQACTSVSQDPKQEKFSTGLSWHEYNVNSGPFSRNRLAIILANTRLHSAAVGTTCDKLSRQHQVFNWHGSACLSKSDRLDYMFRVRRSSGHVDHHPRDIPWTDSRLF